MPRAPTTHRRKVVDRTYVPRYKQHGAPWLLRYSGPGHWALLLECGHTTTRSNAAGGGDMQHAFCWKCPSPESR